MPKLPAVLAALAAALALAGCSDSQPDRPLQRQATLSAARHAVASAPDAYTGLVQQLYVAFFGRPADPAGLAFHAQTLARLGAPADMRGLAAAYETDPGLRSLVNGLSDSAEAQALYGSGTGRLIGAVYQQSFNRDAEPDGLAYWTGIIDRHGLNRAAAVMGILAGSLGTDLATFGRKAEAAGVFTTTVGASGSAGLYSGLGSNALVRDMLGVVHGSSSDADIRLKIDASLAALATQGAYVVQQGYAEAPAGVRSVTLLAAPAQLATLRGRLDTLAAVLAADLNGRAGQYGPAWKVLVQEAAATVPELRRQLQGMAGAILVGDVVVPTRIDLANGETVPDLDPYRVPSCPRYSFPAGNAVVEAKAGGGGIWSRSELRACRNGMTVSVLRGTSPARQAAELAAKLDQMIAYHRASDAANAGWMPAYRHVNALWLRTAQALDTGSFWNDIPLYDAGQVAYLDSGTGAERLSSFRACLGSTTEMCTFNGHGGSGLVVAEGPDPARDVYSSDSVDFTAAQLRSSAIRAKFVNLQSCSTQNFLQPDSFGSTMVMGGDALLALGATAVVFQSTEVDKGYVQSLYQSLSYGATFAEAFTGKMNGPALALQGDPFISLRPKPAGAQPKLVIDGRRFNSHPALVELAFGDSTNRSRTVRTLVVTNPGTADLKLRLSIMPENVASTGKTAAQEGDTWEGLGFTMEAPQASSNSGFGNVGNLVHVVPPGGTLLLKMSFQPIAGWPTGEPLGGTYTGTYELYSDDPQSPRVVFEMVANAR